MQPIAKVLQTARPGFAAKGTNVSDSPAPSIDPIRQAALRRFWARMAAIYGHRWTSAYGDTPEDTAGALTVAGDTWRRGLVGITETRVGEGLTACLRSSEPWPPTLPEFRAYCLAVPTLAAVRLELPKAERSDFGRLVWSYIDPHRFRLADTATSERMLRDAYDTAREFVMRGGEIPAPAPALTGPAPKLPEFAFTGSAAPASPETIAARLGLSESEAVYLDPEPTPEPQADLGEVERELQQHYDRKTAAGGGS